MFLREHSPPSNAMRMHAPKFGQSISNKPLMSRLTLQRCRDFEQAFPEIADQPYGHFQFERAAPDRGKRPFSDLFIIQIDPIFVEPRCNTHKGETHRKKFEQLAIYDINSLKCVRKTYAFFRTGKIVVHSLSLIQNALPSLPVNKSQPIFQATIIL